VAECRPPQARARRQAPDQSVDEREEAGEAQAEALLKTAERVGSRGQWLAQNLDIVLRHRAPSIPRHRPRAGLQLMPPGPQGRRLGALRAVPARPAGIEGTKIAHVADVLALDRV